MNHITGRFNRNVSASLWVAIKSTILNISSEFGNPIFTMPTFVGDVLPFGKYNTPSLDNNGVKHGIVGCQNRTPDITSHGEFKGGRLYASAHQLLQRIRFFALEQIHATSKIDIKEILT